MKKLSKGFTLVELLVVIGILGILMGVLFPTISSAMQNAKTSACSTQGRKLFTEITQADISREQKGMASIWPRTSDTQSDDTEDIAGKTYSTSADYFKELFNLDNYGKEEWDPYVKCDLDVISGYGVVPFNGSSFQGDNVLWCIAQGVETDLPEVIPVLVSRNCCTEDLFTTGSFSGNEQQKVKIGKDNGGESNIPFGSKIYVIVRKGGAPDVIEMKYSKQYLLYKHQGFTISSSSQFKYLKTGCK